MAGHHPHLPPDLSPCGPGSEVRSPVVRHAHRGELADSLSIPTGRDVRVLPQGGRAPVGVGGDLQGNDAVYGAATGGAGHGDVVPSDSAVATGRRLQIAAGGADCSPWGSRSVSETFWTPGFSNVSGGTSSTMARQASTSWSFRSSSALSAGSSAPAMPRPCSTFTRTGRCVVWPGKSATTLIAPVVRGSKPAITSLIADGNTLTPRTINMSSVRPKQRIFGAVRPHRQEVLCTSTWPHVWKRGTGESSRSSAV